ncbi:MAG: M15 family metallopeptidase [Marmoricola sp.]
MGTQRRWVRAAACAVLLLSAACGSPAATKPSAQTKPGTATPKASASSSAKPDAAPQVDKSVAVDPPGKLSDPLLSSDVLVYSQDTLDESTVTKIKAIRGVTKVELISMGSFYADDQEVTYAAVDPATFRRFTMQGTAQTTAVWDRVAQGEIAVQPAMGRKLKEDKGYVTVGNEASSARIHIGAYAQILPPTVARRIDAVVNYKWAAKLGMREHNAMLVAMGSRSPQDIRKQLKQYAGTKASVQILGPDLDIKTTQTAFLTGGNVAAAVGSFSYRANPDGTVAPDPAWLRANIRTEVMPIIGSVTGHRVMLPQLRGALTEVVSRGLAGKIRTFDGCYVPRFIAKDPARGLSFHTFGTAIDLNASTNYRGIAGDMDRTVVKIFKDWGFAWGGDWNYTDPMHFELANLAAGR